MKIGIKYCGGCNPRFDRRKFVEKLIDDYKDVIVEPANENENYDIILVVCGCCSACADHESLNGAHKKIITSEYDFYKVKRIINKLYYEQGGKMH